MFLHKDKVNKRQSAYHELVKRIIFREDKDHLKAHKAFAVRYKQDDK